MAFRSWQARLVRAAWFIAAQGVLMKPSGEIFSISRALRMALAVGALSLPMGAQAAIQIYNLNVTNLVQMPNNCGAGSMYNCGSTVSGFSWLDVNAGATINSVSIRYNIGVDCHATGTVLPTRLNATVGPSLSAVNWCSCSLRENVYGAALPASAYIAGATNNFIFTATTTCLGSCPSAANLGGAYAIVTVDYTAGAPGACNLAPIEAKLDDGTRFTSDAERTAQTTLHQTQITTAQNNMINNNNAQTTTLSNILNDGTRFTNDAERIAMQNAIVTEINANETKIDRLETKLDTETRFTDDSEFAVGLQALAALEAKADEESNNTQYALQIEIEHALGEDNNVNKPLILYMLPSAGGGHLEEVRDLVDARITQAEANGCNTGGARGSWDNGVVQYGLSHWESAYAAFAGAYRTASMGPCN